MSWLFSQALVEEYSEGISSGGEPSAPLNVMPTPQQFWRNDKPIDVLKRSPFGLQWKPLTDDLGEAVLMSYLEAFPARTSAPPEKEQESTEKNPVCSSTWQELLVRFDRDTSSWRTHHCLWEEDLPESSVRLGRWGMMRDGQCWEREMPEHLISGTESGSWPTPTQGMHKQDVNDNGRYAMDIKKKGHQIMLPAEVKLREQQKWPTPTAAEAGKISNQANYGQKGLSNHPAIVGEPTRPKEKKSRKGEKNWPTPVARDYEGPQPTVRKNGQPRATHLPNAVEEEPSDGQLNPTWVEAYLLGWPIAWTSMEPLPKEVFHEWERTFLTGSIVSNALETDRSPSVQP